MKALMKKNAGPGLNLVEVAEPVIQPNQVLVKVRKTAICGTDLHIYKWDEWAQKTVPVPLVIGHEFMGEVIAVGESVKHVSIGDRVTAEGHLTCGTCLSCKIGMKHLCMNTRGIGYHCSGIFSEYASIPEENIFMLPSFISDEIGAIFDPFGNAVHTALSFPLICQDVLITGAGPLGLMAVAIAKKAGARHIVITDVNDYRLEMARKMGATAAINISKETLSDTMQTLDINHGFSVGLEMSGNGEAFAQMVNAMRHGGNIALLGILPENCPIDWNLVIFRMLNIKGIYGRQIFLTWYQMTHLVESGLNLAPIITHQIPYKEYQKGFEVMMSGQSGKVILDW